MTFRQALFAALACAAAAAAHAAPSFHLVDLGPDWIGAQPVAVNAAGDVAGSSARASCCCPTRNVTTQVGNANGWLQHPTAMNDRDTLVGDALDGTLRHPARSFVVREGQATLLLPQIDDAMGVNNRGAIVGNVAAGDGAFHAAIYADHRVTDIGTLPGGVTAGATAINDRGVVAGWSDTGPTTPPHVFRYQGGVMTDLGALSSDFDLAVAGINASGTIVGTSSVDGIVRGFVSVGDQLTDIGTLAPGLGSAISQANGINAAGHVVGASTTDCTQCLVMRAFFRADGRMADLNTLVADLPDGWVLDDAYAINDRDQVVATAYARGGFERHVVLLTPLPR